MTPQTRDMLGRTGLLSVEEATRTLLEALPDPPFASEELPLTSALRRITARQIVSAEQLPPVARSTMDGYAVIAADTFGAGESAPCYLDVTGEVNMGRLPDGRVESGCCWKIPTGGTLPAGADAVVMFEQTVPVDDRMLEVTAAVGPGSNIIQAGEDMAQGAPAVEAKHRLRPQDLALLAGLGVTTVEVMKRPRVTILSTGDELVPFRQTPRAGQIRDLNSVALAALAEELGAEVRIAGIVSDEEECFLAALTAAAETSELVLFSGGSSVGTRDLGERAITRLGTPGVLVHGVKLKPGKPVLIGLVACNGPTPVFGLPGHPVSAMVCFELFVRPALGRLTGAAPPPRPAVTARLCENLNSAPGRLDVIRVQLEREDTGWRARPVHGRSGAISTLTRAEGWFFIEEAVQGLAAGESVNVFLL